MTAAAANTATLRAHFVGGGIGSLAAAAFMIRDGKVPGENISIYEAMNVLGGALDGAGNAIDGYRLRGGRMLTSDNYECVWDLFKTVPSLETRRSRCSMRPWHSTNTMSRMPRHVWSIATATGPT